MAVQPGKPHWVLPTLSCPPETQPYPIVTPIELTQPPKSWVSPINKKSYRPLPGNWWKVEEQPVVYHESSLKPLDNPGDDEVDTHSLRKTHENHAS